jgi:hypothetical protein
MSDALIPVRRAEIAIGKPLPWAVYDANHTLLLNKGVVVTSQFQLETLMEKGMYREGRPPMPSHLHPDRELGPATDALEGGSDMPFDRVHLAAGDLLQIQALQEGVSERYNVRFIGMLKGKSVLVTNPVVDDKVIFVREGQNYLVRAFSGVNVCGFKARVLKSCLTPYPYLHLSYPTSVHAVRLRQAMRAPVDIIVSIYEQEGGDMVASGRMVDVSVGGAKIFTPVPIGKKGSRVFVAFKIKLDEIEEVITTPAYVRSLAEEKDEKGKSMQAIGIQFADLNQSQRLLIMNLVYQHLFKES